MMEPYLRCLKKFDLTLWNDPTTEPDEQWLKRVLLFILQMYDAKTLSEVSKCIQRDCGRMAFLMDPQEHAFAWNRMRCNNHDIIIRPAKKLSSTRGTLLLQYLYPTHDFLLNPDEPVLISYVKKQHMQFWKYSKESVIKTAINFEDITPTFEFSLACAIRTALSDVLTDAELFDSCFVDCVNNPYYGCSTIQVPHQIDLVKGIYLSYGIVTNRFISSKYAPQSPKASKEQVQKYLQERLDYWINITSSQGQGNNMTDEEDVINIFPELEKMYKSPVDTARSLQMPLFTTKVYTNNQLQQNDIKQLNRLYDDAWEIYIIYSGASIREESYDTGYHFGYNYYVKVKGDKIVRTRSYQVGGHRNACLGFALVSILHDIYKRHGNDNVSDSIRKFDYKTHTEIKEYILHGTNTNVLRDGSLSRNFIYDVLWDPQLSDIEKTELEEIKSGNDYIAIDYFMKVMSRIGFQNNEVAYLNESTDNAKLHQAIHNLLKIPEESIRTFHNSYDEEEIIYPDMYYTMRQYRTVTEYCMRTGQNIADTLSMIGFTGYQTADSDLWFYAAVILDALDSNNNYRQVHNMLRLPGRHEQTTRRVVLSTLESIFDSIGTIRDLTDDIEKIISE